MVTPGKKALERIKKEQVFSNQMRSVNSNNEFFILNFVSQQLELLQENMEAKES